MRDAGVFYYRKVRVYECTLGGASPQEKESDSRVHLASEDEIESLTSGERGRLKNEWRGRIADGNHCFVAVVGGSLAGYLWIMRTAAPINEVSAVFNPSKLPDSAYVHNVNVLPEFRRRGVFTAMVRGAKRWSYENGIKTLYVAVAKDNKVADQAHRGAGFDKEVARIRYLKLFGLESKKIKFFGGRAIENAIS